MRMVRLGLLGCGGFARNMHVPNISKNPRLCIRATMDVDAKAARSMATEVGAEYWTDSLEEILGDDNIDAVLITTRHDSHADLSIQAARAGKHILCEKPMALSIDEVHAIVSAVKEAGVLYTVGYNRGLSPLVTKAKQLLREWDGKIMIYHRIQAPFPEDSWTHDPAVGGGRFIGEGCHIFDLMSVLMKSPPVSVFAAGGTFLDPAKVKMPDSAVVTLTFADGSIGTTLINSAGCSSFEKEATEIYCDGKAISILNFQTMSWHGMEGSEDGGRIELDAVDKGHMVELELFAEAVLNNAAPPNGLEQAAEAAVISYKVMESLRTGMPVPISETEYRYQSTEPSPTGTPAERV